MTESQDPLLMDHEVDGIRELDNKLPRWWVWLFYLTTIFAIVYVMYFHVLHIGRSSAAQYAQEVAKARGPELEPVAGASGAVASAGAAVEPLTDPAVISHGRDIFKANCVVCHGQNGEGLIGPNLCDDYWIHGPTFADNLHTIREGVPAKGMITWKNMMKPDDIMAVASYIYTLRGSNPPNPKPPEGKKAEAPAPPPESNS